MTMGGQRPFSVLLTSLRYKIRYLQHQLYLQTGAAGTK